MTDLPPIRLLALARLLAAGAKGEGRDKLVKDLRPLLEEAGAGWAEHLDDALAGLESDGAIAREEAGKGRKKTARFALTDEGRRLAKGAFGVETLPAKVTWAKVQAEYLTPLALGQAGGKLDLKAEILRKHYGLDLQGRAKLKDASEAMGGKLLGLEPGQAFNADTILRKLLKDAGIELAPSAKKADAKAIGEALLRRELGDPSAKKPLDLLATRAVSAQRDSPAILATAILSDWVKRSPLPPVAATPLELGAFARRVVEAARRSPTGRFGDDQVFIAQVRRVLEDDPDFAGMDDATFKGRLVEAHRARLLELGRADLVEAMDPAAVRESATPYLNAVYHFVRIEDQAR